MAKIIVQDTEITVSNVNGEDYICITDMLKAKDGDFFVTDWLRNRNTMEFLGVWERVYNPNFNYGEFATIRNQSGLNGFKISVKEFVARTGAISLQAKAGRYGVPALMPISWPRLSAQLRSRHCCSGQQRACSSSRGERHARNSHSNYHNQRCRTFSLSTTLGFANEKQDYSYDD